MAVPYTTGLHEVAPHTYAWLQPPGSWGQSNGGLLVGADGDAVLVDTPWTLERTRWLQQIIADARPDARITTVVNTHPNGDHCWGNQLLAGAEIVASEATSAGMHTEIAPEAMTAMLHATAPDSPLGAYLRRYFGVYDFSGIVLTQPTRTFTGETTVLAGDRVVRLVEVGPAHTDGDVIAHAADVGVLYAGDILFIGDHPVMWSGPIDNWVNACEQILTTGAAVVVPGHGPVTDAAGVALFRDYLQHVAHHARRYCTQGVDHEVAAERIAGSWRPRWGHPERLVLTVGAIYRQLGAPVPGRDGLILAMAQMHHRNAAGTAAGGA